MKRIIDKDKTELKLDILEFAYTNNLAIHPEKDLDGFCSRTIAMGHCICRDNVLYCPCEESLSLCKQEGHCTCRLFITQKTYPLELTKFRKRWRRKHERQEG